MQKKHRSRWTWSKFTIESRTVILNLFRKSIDFVKWTNRPKLIVHWRIHCLRLCSMEHSTNEPTTAWLNIPGCVSWTSTTILTKKQWTKTSNGSNHCRSCSWYSLRLRIKDWRLWSRYHNQRKKNTSDDSKRLNLNSIPTISTHQVKTFQGCVSKATIQTLIWTNFVTNSQPLTKNVDTFSLNVHQCVD